jgi:hypothetical protein
MGTIALDGAAFLVHLDGEGDVRQLRVALRGADGAEEIDLEDDTRSVKFDASDEFNVIALWMVGFRWEREALESAFELIAPLARNALDIHSRSRSRLMHRAIDLHKKRPTDDEKDGEP